MSEVVYEPRGLFYEDFDIGQQVMTAARTITESDIVQFAGLTGDFNQMHTDAVYAANGMFGQRVAHGMLVLSVAVGLAVRTGVIEGTVLAFREQSCKFSKPVFIGDTVRVQLDVKEKKAFRRLGGGNITLAFRVLNSEDEVVQRGEWVMLIRSRES